MTLNVGDKAPNFTLLADNQQTISLQTLRGKKVILYFYPKDNTPGCTQEACDFRDSSTDFSALNTVVLGISKDSPEAHVKFKAKYNLPFPLLSDTNAKVCEAYGVINPKSLFGKTFLGIQRSTFLIDEQGVLRAIWRKVKVKNHSATVLSQLKKLETCE